MLGTGYFFTGHPFYWNKGLLIEGFVWMLVCSLVAWILQCLQPQRASILFCGLLLIYLFLGTGIISTLSVIFFLASAHTTGFIALKLTYGTRRQNLGGTESLIIGLLLWIAIGGILIHFPINRRWLYILLFALPLLWGLYRNSSNLLHTYTEELRYLRTWIQNIPLPLLVICVALIAWVARFTFFPTVGLDDNGNHLRLWIELLYQKKYSFDVITQIWEVAPFAVNLLHALTSLMAGEDARGAMDLALMLLLLRQMMGILETLNLTAVDRLLILLLTLSTPMLGVLLTSLQTELFLALLCTTGMQLILNCDEGWKGRNVLAVFAIAALCVATKLPGIVLGLLILLTLLIKLRFFKPSNFSPLKNPKLSMVLLLLGIMSFVAFHAYVTAYWITGNPVFPLYNGIFKSPFFWPSNFSHDLYMKGFSFKNYWNVFFKTSEFYESKDFVAGFQYLFLLPLALLVLWRREVPRSILLLLLPLLGFGLLMFQAMQYWRYIFPVMPLACLVIAVLLLPSKNFFPSMAKGLIVACIILNFFFFPGISWMFMHSLQSLYTQSGKNELTEWLAGDKTITEYLNENSPGARVLYLPTRPFGASLKGTPIYIDWYSPARVDRFLNIKTSEEMASFIRDEKVQFFIWDLRNQSQPGEPEWLLREYMSTWSYPELQKGTFILFRLADHKIPYREIFNLRTSTKSALPIQISNEPKIITALNTLGARTIKYHLSFKCSEAKGNFIMSTNWNIGDPYYRLLPCKTNIIKFSESLPIPIGANQGNFNLTVHDVPSAELSDLKIEIY